MSDCSYNSETVDKIRKAQAKWEGENDSAFRTERKAAFVSSEGIPIKRVYTPADLAEKNFDYLDELNFPGAFPYTRGTDPSVYRGKIYKIGQYAGASSAEETNRLFKDLIAHGQQSLHIAFDLPTKNGYDSDNPMAAADVGKSGIAIDSLQDMEILFDGIDLGKYACTLVITSSIGPILLAMLLAAAEKQGQESKLSGVMQNDVLTGYGAGGQYSFPIEAGIRMATDVLSHCARNLPAFDAFNIVQYHWGELGANRIQQVAWPLSIAATYIQEGLRRELDIDLIAPKLRFLLYTGTRDILLEVAKIRAMRRLYARMMKERFGANNPRSCMLIGHHGIGGVDMAKGPLEMNIVRGALGTLAIALSGAGSVGGATYDEPLGIPSKKASIVAIQTRYLIAHESGVMETVDPLGGSYYVEAMTSEIEEQASELIREVDSRGGALEAVKSGYFQREAFKNAYQTQKQTESGELVKIGVNMFAEEAEDRECYQPDLRVRASQTAKLIGLRESRDNAAVQAALSSLKAAARGSGESHNLVPRLLESVKAYATIGEIRAALEEVFGPAVPPTSV